MKREILIGLMAATLLTACGQGSSKKENKETASTEVIVGQTTEASVVNVYYFHGKQRCKTCIAVGNVTEETIKGAYADNPNVKFIEIETDKKENGGLVEKYAITWNALIIAKGDDNVEVTKQAFANAVNSPEKLTELIKAEVDKRL